MPNPITELLTRLKQNEDFMEIMALPEKKYSILYKVNLPLVMLGVRLGAEVKLLEDSKHDFFIKTLEDLGLHVYDHGMKITISKEPIDDDILYSAEYGFEVLGYPKCCCFDEPPATFFTQAISACHKDPEFIKKKRSDIRFVQHVPHSLNCKPSLKLGKRIREVVEEMEKLDILKNGVEEYLSVSGFFMYEMCQVFHSLQSPWIRFLIPENYGTNVKDFDSI